MEIITFIHHINSYFGYLLTFVSLLTMASTCVWLIYLLNEILLNKKKFKFVSTYINDRDTRTEKERCKTNIWKNALLCLICISEGIGVLLGGIEASPRMVSLLDSENSLTNDTCWSEMYIDTQLTGFSILFIMLYITFMNILTGFFISIYSFNSHKKRHKKLLIYTAITTAILVPILLIPGTAIYAQFIALIIMAFSSVNWIKNTRWLLINLKWRGQDREYECSHEALQIHRMARRYKRFIYVVIITMQPVIVSLFLQVISQCLTIVGKDCGVYFMLKYLDMFQGEAIALVNGILAMLVIITMAPAIVILLVPYILYTFGYLVFLMWKYMVCGSTKRINTLSQPFLKY